MAPPPAACRSNRPSTTMSGWVRTVARCRPIQPGGDDHVEGAVLVLEQQERDAVGGAGSLTGDHQPADNYMGAVVDLGEFGWWTVRRAR